MIYNKNSCNIRKNAYTKVKGFLHCGMKRVIIVKLKELRELKKMSQSEVARLSGINYRSYQDYEQGHKDLSKAKGEMLYRLSLTLGCSMEELISDYVVYDTDDEKLTPTKVKDITKLEIENYKIFEPNYKINGRWKFDGDSCMLVFNYKGKLVKLPFQAYFTKEVLIWLSYAAMMMIEDYIEDDYFNKIVEERMKGDEFSDW